MNFRIKVLGAFIPLCLLLCFMSNTYSRYVADTTGNLKIAFAQWQILVNNNDITNNTTSSVVLNPIINENEYVESNKLAPSSSGYFDISIDPTNVDVAFNYEITLRVGPYSCLHENQLNWYFEILGKGTCMEDAVIKIERDDSIEGTNQMYIKTFKGE